MRMNRSQNGIARVEGLDGKSGRKQGKRNGKVRKVKENITNEKSNEVEMGKEEQNFFKVTNVRVRKLPK